MTVKNIIYHQLIRRNYYAITGSARVLPDFLIIGAKRCGTTTLFQYLPEHPSIARSHHDNMGFFSDNFHLGVNWYRSFFPTKFFKNKIKKKHNEFRAFDVTTKYIESKKTAENIRTIKSNMKIIVILRNPIDRVFSQFHTSIRDGEEKRRFEEVINYEIDEINKELSDKKENHQLDFRKGKQNYIKKSLYAMQLNHWFGVFPKENILVLSTEDLKTKKIDTYNQIFDFLKLPRFVIKGEKIMQKGNYEPMKKDTRKNLYEFFKEHNEDLFNLIDKRFDWNN